jgi:hypothetical protein
MTRRRTPTEASAPDVRLAQALFAAWLDAKVRLDRYHDADGWDELRTLGRCGWLAVARGLIARGVQPPPQPRE